MDISEDIDPEPGVTVGLPQFWCLFKFREGSDEDDWGGEISVDPGATSAFSASSSSSRRA